MTGARKDKDNAKPKQRRTGNEANLIRWRQSPESRAIGSQTLAKINRERRSLPRCGAKRKRDSRPCEGIALENGRCRVHGGLTPKGDNWHRPRLPKPGEPRGIERLDKKLASIEKRLQDRARRLAAMTPEQREKHLKWHASHKPKTDRQREQTRQDRAAKKWLADVMNRAEPDAASKPPPKPKRPRNSTTPTHDGIFA